MFLIFLHLLVSSGSVISQQCGPLTTKDAEGPFFVANADLEYEIAPANEIADNTQATVLRGQVLDRNCKGVGGATVEVWYAGWSTVEYTFRPAKLWYRGKTRTNKDGFYQFLATFPGTYDQRPITHYHYKVVYNSQSASLNTFLFLSLQVNSPGRNGKSLTTQAYFRDRIPAGYENYVRSRGTQFATVRDVGSGGVLVNGGRIVTFNIKMDVGQFGFLG